MTHLSRSGAWDPLTPEEVALVFAGAPIKWWIAGGCAIDLFLGHRSRHHEDIDVGVFRNDQQYLHELLAHWDLHEATTERLRPWCGELLDPAINDVWGRTSATGSWRMQIMLNDGDYAEWIYRRDRTIRLPVHAAIRRTTTGIPYLAPQVQLLFKAKDPRPKDYADAALVIPRLDPDERSWLRRMLARSHSGHPWIAELTADQS